MLAITAASDQRCGQLLNIVNVARGVGRGQRLCLCQIGCACQSETKDSYRRYTLKRQAAEGSGPASHVTRSRSFRHSCSLTVCAKKRNGPQFNSWAVERVHANRGK